MRTSYERENRGPDLTIQVERRRDRRARRPTLRGGGAMRITHQTAGGPPAVMYEREAE